MVAPEAGKTALVVGIGGQDAAYLARLLLGKGYRVVGTSRDATLANRAGLRTLGIEAQVTANRVRETIDEVAHTELVLLPVVPVGCSARASVGVSTSTARVATKYSRAARSIVARTSSVETDAVGRQSVMCRYDARWCGPYARLPEERAMDPSERGRARTTQ